MGGNLRKCKEELDKTVDNSAIFKPNKPIFAQDCFAHVLSGACKANVLNVKTNDGLPDLEKVRSLWMIKATNVSWETSKDRLTVRQATRKS
jgi:hypothetical protein